MFVDQAHGLHLPTGFTNQVHGSRSPTPPVDYVHGLGLPVGFMNHVHQPGYEPDWPGWWTGSPTRFVDQAGKLR
jgi:hypothetical protein